MNYNQSPEGGENLYDDSPAQEQPEQESEENSGEVTATLPKEILAGKDFKVGDEIVLKIVGLYDNSVAVKYASEGGSEQAAPAAPPPSGMASMME